MSIPQYGDYQLDIYFDGLEGRLPRYPVDFASLERKAAQVLPSWVHSSHPRRPARGRRPTHLAHRHDQGGWIMS
jgi:hypothetical protein